MCRRVHNFLVGDVICKGRFASVRSCFAQGSQSFLCARIVPNALPEQIVSSETKIAPLLRHPNILKVIKSFDTQKAVFQISKFYKSRSLLHLLNNSEFEISFDVKLRMAADIIAAIYYLHGHFICHRDIKLENVLVSGKFDGNGENQLRCKLCDFGLAASSFDGNMRGKVGSFHYVSPECVRCETYNGFASDMWSLGVLMFALFSGKMPYPDLDKGFNYEKDVDFSDIDVRIRGVIKSLLNKEPKRRPTIQELVENPIFKDIVKINKDVDDITKNFDDPIDNVDNIAASRISQMLNVDIMQVVNNVKKFGRNIVKLLYILYEEKEQRVMRIGGFDSIIPDKDDIKLPISSCVVESQSLPTSLSQDIIIRSFKASSNELYQFLCKFVVSRNGCITEPTSSTREIVFNLPEENVNIPFDCFDTDLNGNNTCSIILSNTNFSNDLLDLISEKFEEVY